MTITYAQSFINKSITATSDAAFSLSKADLWLREANILILNNAALTGDRNGQDFNMGVASVATFPFLNLADFFVKNASAGSNTTIIVNGVLMSPKMMQDYGLVVR